MHGYKKREAFMMHDLWSIHLYLYDGSVRVGEREFPFFQNSITITPPNVKLEWSFPDQAPHYYAHVRAPQEGVIAVEAGVYGPFPWIEEAISEFEFIGGHYLTIPTAAKARLWALLWKAISHTNADQVSASDIPATVQIAIAIIEQSLSQRIVISELANQVGVSHNHLISLFRKTYRLTVSQYIQERRCRRAAFLLNKTSLPIKAIAQEVGLPDLHHFNKTVRSFFGVSPTELRTRLSSDQGPAPYP